MARRRRPGARLLAACAAVLLVAAGSVASAAEEADIVIKKLERTISLKAPIVTITDTVDARSAPSSKTAAPPSRFLVCYTRALADRLAYVELEVDGKGQDGWARVSDAELDHLAGAMSSRAAGCFAFPLDAAAGQALASGTKLSAYASFARALVPRPAAVAQGEPQHVLFTDAALRAVSPYRVEQQAIEALTPSGVKPLSFSPAGKIGVLKSSSSGGIIKFTPSGATEPWAALGGAEEEENRGDGASSAAALSVHFPLDEPLVRGLRVVREVEVSHWGNVYFEETYLVRNDGPTVDGEFSRRRYSDRSAFLGHMFENLRARLPPQSRWIYFRDAIGNVSTSAVHRLPKGVNLGGGEKMGKHGAAASAAEGGGGVVVDLGVRYPMLGGWEVDFVLGYSLPLSSVVSRIGGSGAGGRMRLRVPLPAPVEGMYVDNLEVRVVLPEGAKKIAHAAPSAPNAKASLERKSTYLDAPWGPGRPVLALRLPNAVPDHASARLTVEYTIGALDLLRKPLLLVAAFGAVFAALALFNRADFSIAPSSSASGGGKAQAQKVKAA